MKSVRWKDAVELVGIAAIVASLIFVGLELRQTRDIALADSAWNLALSQIEARRPIYEFPDIWKRGNAGEELNPSEAVIYRTLIRDFNTLGFLMHLSALHVDDPDTADVASWDMAGFLYENPGARREWESLRAQLRRYREPHKQGEYRNVFEEVVRKALEDLDQTDDQ